MPAGKSAAAVREHLMQLLAPIVSGAGCDLEDIAVSSAGRRSVLRVSIDADGGVDLDTVAEVSRLIGEALGDNDGFDGPYVLEVGSPGVDRPLTEPRHWRRAQGRLVSVQAAGVPLTGRVVAVDGHGVRIQSAAGAQQIAWGELGRGRVQVEFQRDTGEDD
ncbi:MAG: ribosome maturation factor RimP [Frankiaceae bacterium]|jgi:ribosome maturation factor RimP|nr:ribosome maturation factor RimP [Frankiaceae bacterium]